MLLSLIAIPVLLLLAKEGWFAQRVHMTRAESDHVQQDIIAQDLISQVFLVHPDITVQSVVIPSQSNAQEEPSICISDKRIALTAPWEGFAQLKD